MKKYFFILFFLVKEGQTQPAPGVRDTSFTIHNTFIKESKKFPFIKIANPEKSSNIVQKNDIVYRTIGQRELLLDIFYSANKKKRRPAVLLVFGGGWRSGDKSHNYAMATELANKGYVAVSAEYRLSGEAIYPAAVHDLKAGIKWMKQNAQTYGIDTALIAALGCSAGGQLVSLLGTTNYNPAFDENLAVNNHSSAIKAVINIDGLLAFKHPESSEGASASAWLGGSFEQKPDNWTQASALTHVGSATTPFLFINSSIPRFHAGRDDMIAKMNAFGIYSEVHTFPDSPHPFWFFDPWFKPMMKYVLDFLEKQFK